MRSCILKGACRYVHCYIASIINHKNINKKWKVIDHQMEMKE